LKDNDDINRRKFIIKKLIKEAIDKSYFIKCDKLDCNISFARENSDLSLEEILKYKENENLDFIFIKRHNPFDNSENIETGYYFDLNGITYFLFIYCNIKYLDYFVKRYRLVELNADI